MKTPFLSHTWLRRTVTYDVYAHPRYGCDAVRHAFVWPAMLFGIIWNLYRQLWLSSFVLLTVFSIAPTHVSQAWQLVVMIALLAANGALAPYMLSRKLLKNAYSHIGVYQAKCAAEAIHQAYVQGAVRAVCEDDVKSAENITA